MLKKSLLIIAECAFCLFFSCKDEAVYSIKVKLDNLQGNHVYAVFEADDMKKVDTLTLSWPDAEEFTVTQMQENFRTLTLYFENRKQWITVYLEPRKRVSVTGDLLYPRLVKVKGGRTNQLLTGFREKSSALLKEQTDLLNILNTSREIQNHTADMTHLANVNHELCLRAEAFVKKYPEEEASAVLIREYLSDPERPLQTEEYLNLLDPKLDDFYIVKELKNATEKAKRTLEGMKAPDFNVININGESCSTASFIGNCFILAFVSMWSDGCQTKELLLDEIISSYPNDRLGVMLVSLDEDQRQVRELVSKDSIRWNIVTDSAGQAIELIDLYNVNMIPQCYLMDIEGNILLKTENGIELKQVLEKWMDKD
jgi:peroxiredoxin